METTSKKKGPLYYTVKEAIKEQIRKGELKKGEVIPTEKMLCEEYQASRVTIRRAIEELIEEDVLERGFGKTATVKFDKVPRKVNNLTSLQEEMEKIGVKCTSFILNSEIMEAPPEVAEEMKLPEGEKVVKIERLRYANEKPLCYQVLYLSERLCGALEPARLVSQSLYRILEQEMGIRIKRADQVIQAVMSTYRITALLELPAQTSMLFVKRIAYTEAEECLEYSESFYVGDRYNLTMSLFREI